MNLKFSSESAPYILFIVYADKEKLFMLSSKQTAELDKLIKIAKDRDDKLNSTFFYNVIAAMSEENRRQDVIYEMQEYLLSAGIGITLMM